MTSEPLISAPPAEAEASAAELAAALAEHPTRVRWVIFSLACTTSFLLYLHRYTWGVVKVELAREFGWDKDTLGWLDSAFMLTYAFGQIPGGMLGDWFGPRMILAAMILLWSAAMGGTAIATGLPGMAGVRLLFGLAQAGCYPNLSKTTKLWFPSSERTAVQGWVASFFGRMGGATSYLLFATVLIGWCHMPWRVALGLFMLLGFAAAVGFLLFFRNSPREHPWVNAAEAHLISDNDPGAATATRSTLKWSTVLRNGSLRALVFQQFTCAYVDNFFSSWIPLFLFEQKHVKLDATGWMSALPMVGGALGGDARGRHAAKLVDPQDRQPPLVPQFDRFDGQSDGDVHHVPQPDARLRDRNRWRILSPQILFRLGAADDVGRHDRHGRPQRGIHFRPRQHRRFARRIRRRPHDGVYDSRVQRRRCH
jgi:sugar phosphate permease